MQDSWSIHFILVFKTFISERPDSIEEDDLGTSELSQDSDPDDNDKAEDLPEESMFNDQVGMEINIVFKLRIGQQIFYIDINI